MGYFLGGSFAQEDREPLSGERAEAGKGGHGRLRLSHALRLVYGGIAAIQEEVPEGAIGVQVSAQDRLVVYLELQEGGKGRHSLTARKVERGTITLSWHGLARVPSEPSRKRDRVR